MIGTTLATVTENCASAARTRSAKSATDPYVIASSGVEASVGGTESGGMRKARSPAMVRDSRLVVSRLTVGFSRRSDPTTRRASLTTCSQLSKISRQRLSERYDTIESRSGRRGDSWTPRVDPRACTTSAGSLSEASSTNQTPSGKCWRRFIPTVMAVRVFPAPPVPTMLTNGALSSNSPISLTTSSRPRNDVS